MLAWLDAFQKMLCFHPPLRTSLLLVSMWAISSSVGALWFSLIMALFKSLGLRQILSLPFGFFGYVSELTQGVGSICFIMIPWWTILFSSFSISALYSIGTLHLPCYRWYLRIDFNVILTWHVANSIKTVGIQGLQVLGTINQCTTWFHIDDWTWMLIVGPLLTVLSVGPLVIFSGSEMTLVCSWVGK